METGNPGKRTSIPQLSRPSLKSTKVEVWGLFIRLFHWSLVVAFLVAYVSGDQWRDVHILAGYAALVLIVFRLFWGVCGGRYARFSNFVKSPKAVAAYFRKFWNRAEDRYLGHNPAGGIMILLLLGLVTAVSVSGALLTTDIFWGSEAMDIIHGALAELTLLCIGLHIFAAFVVGRRRGENLVWSMITGRKRAPEEGDVS